MKKFTSILLSMIMFIAMAVPCYANNGFVGSVTAEPAPDFVVVDDVIAEIIDAEGNVVTTVKLGYMEITPISEKENLTPEAAAALEDVYNKIKNNEITYPQELEDTLGESFAVTDLFNIDITDAEIKAFLDEGNTIKVSLDTKFKKDDVVMVGTYVNGEWVLAKECVVNEDGTITFSMEGLQSGPVAVFVKTAETEEPVVGGDVVDVDTDEAGTSSPFIWIILAVVAAFVAVKTMSKKKKEK